MTAHELRTERLSYRIDDRSVLHDVSLVARAGEAIAVTGPSGSGKSTLLWLLAGLLQPTEGAVFLDGQSLEHVHNLRRRCGLILQSYSLLSVLTAAENIALSLQAGARRREDIDQRVAASLDAVHLAGSAGQLVEELSGGQQQRLAVARALAGSPDLVIADEPTSELDAANRAIVVRLLTDHAREGAIVVIATDDEDVVSACDRETRLLDGGVSSA